MTYAETIQFLYSLRWFGAKLGLENTLRLAERTGNPHHQLRFIHVAGTNGKGSTCAMLENIYRAAGLRVGLFTSPHLISFRERIQVNRQLISEVEVVRLAAELQTAAGDDFPPVAGPALQPTFFEFVTVMALRYFVEQHCDLVIWETGLGGRLDATNIVTPLASVITNIGLDHQQWLGDTLGKIAYEKAGIIKPGVPVWTTAAEPEALAVITEVARAQGAPLTLVDAEAAALSPPPASLPGQHQRLNAALAVATARGLQSQIPLTDEQIRVGLAQVNWPGRMQWITRATGQRVLLDGAHNVAGVLALRAALLEEMEQLKFMASQSRSEPGAPSATVVPLTLILGVLADKDWPAICAGLAPLAACIRLVAVGSERTADPQALATACRAANPAAEVVVCPSLAAALAQSEHAPWVVITGSLYLVGAALEQLGSAAVPAADEKALNDWQPKVNAVIPAPLTERDGRTDVQSP